MVKCCSVMQVLAILCAKVLENTMQEVCTQGSPRLCASAAIGPITWSKRHMGTFSMHPGPYECMNQHEDLGGEMQTKNDKSPVCCPFPEGSRQQCPSTLSSVSSEIG